MSLLALFLVGARGATGAGVAGAMPAATLQARVNAYLQPLTREKQFGGAVLITRAGKVLVSRGYGMADVEANRPNTSRTVYQLASVSKAFAVVAILQLQEQGKLKVTDHLCRYLASCPSSWRPITLKNLMTHTSGISDNCCPDTADTVPKIVAFLQSEPLAFKPGTQWAYTTTEYNLLGPVIAAVSHESYRTYIRSHILRPLHMTDTGFMDTYAAQPDHAVGYDPSGAVPLPDFSFPAAVANFFWGGGGLYSSIRDMERWDQALSTPRLISRASLHAMFTRWVKTGVPADGPPYSSYYGYGWFLDSLLNRPIAQHPGGTRRAWSYYMRFLKSRVTIIVLSNWVSVGPGRDVIMTHLAGLVFGRSTA